MGNTYLNSILISPPYILGKKLNNISAFHYLALDGFNSPFVKGGEVKPQDIATFIYVCSLSFAERYKLSTPAMFLELAAETERIEAMPVSDLQRAVEQINLALQRYLELPQFWVDTKHSGKSGIPVAFKVAASVLQSFNFTEQEVWDMPFNLLCCYRSSVVEDSGIAVRSEAEQAIIDKLKAKEAKEAEARATEKPITREQHLIALRFRTVEEKEQFMRINNICH